MTLVFLVMGCFLAWKVGNGSQVRIGEYSIMGCGRDIFFLEGLVHHLYLIGKVTLNLIDKLVETTLQCQGWLREGDLGLKVEWELDRGNFVTTLERDDIIFCNEDHELIWAKELLFALSIIQLYWIVEAREEWKNDPSVWTLIQ